MCNKIDVTIGHRTYEIESTDIEAFHDHMKKFYEVCRIGALTRNEYENACLRFGVDALPETSMDSSGVKFGDFGMSHYFTEPENRNTCIKMLLAQRRGRTRSIEKPKEK